MAITSRDAAVTDEDIAAVEAAYGNGRFGFRRCREATGESFTEQDVHRAGLTYIAYIQKRRHREAILAAHAQGFTTKDEAERALASCGEQPKAEDAERLSPQGADAVTRAAGQTPDSFMSRWEHVIKAMPIREADPQPSTTGTEGAAQWRVGRRVPRNVYRGDEPICMVASAEIAAEMVAALNSRTSLRQEADRLRGERDEFERQIEALDRKLQSLAPHGSCACSYDKPGDVCLHHSPALTEALGRVGALEEALRPFAKAGELFGPREPDAYDQSIYAPAAGPEYSLCGGDLRRAREALSQGAPDDA